MTLELKHFQTVSARKLTMMKRAVLGSDVGTGKTVVAIKAADWSRERHTTAEHPNPKWFVVAPLSVKLNWLREIKRWSLYPNVQIINGYKDIVDTTAQWVIFTYNVYTYIRKNRPEALGETPLGIICDEAHRLKGIDLRGIATQRAQYLLGKNSLAKSTLHTWLLTGDPFPRNICDGYMLFNFCLYGKLGRFREFAEKFAYVSTNKKGYDFVVGCNRRTLPEFVEASRQVLVRDTVESARLELPSLTEQIVYLEPPKEIKKLIESNEELQKQIEKAIAAGYEPPNDEGTPLHEMRMAFGKAKAADVVEFVTDLIDQGLKVAVFGHHRDTLQLVHEGLKKHTTSEMIRGGTSAKNREAYIRDFQDGDLETLCLSISAAGEGITLTASRVAVVIEELFTPGALKQMLGRLLRIGQDKPVTFYYMLYPDSIDTAIHFSIRRKAREIKDFWNLYEGKVTEDFEEHIDWGDD